MQPELRPYWVTIWLDRRRTQDYRIEATSAWNAGWLFRQLHPGVEVLAVREVPRR
jgi:hypothetical protein